MDEGLRQGSRWVVEMRVWLLMNRISSIMPVFMDHRINEIPAQSYFKDRSVSHALSPSALQTWLYLFAETMSVAI